MERKSILEILIFPMIVLFLYAGASKLLDIHFFELQLKLSPWIGNYNSTLAWSLPIFEITVAVMLLIGGRLRIIGLYAFGMSLLIFSTYISAVLVSGRKAPCSCGGLIQKLSWPEHIVLNMVFVFLSVIAISLRSSIRNKTEILEPRSI